MNNDTFKSKLNQMKINTRKIIYYLFGQETYIVRAISKNVLHVNTVNLLLTTKIKLLLEVLCNYVKCE